MSEDEKLERIEEMESQIIAQKKGSNLTNITLALKPSSMPKV
jgi:hypothetical protein